MRVTEETLNRGWVGMGWWVSGLLLDAYNNTHQQHFLVKPCVSAQKPDIAVGWWAVSYKHLTLPTKA